MFSKELFRRWTYQVFAPGVLLRDKYNAFRELLRFDDLCLELIAAVEDVHYGSAVADWARRLGTQAAVARSGGLTWRR